MRLMLTLLLSIIVFEAQANILCHLEFIPKKIFNASKIKKAYDFAAHAHLGVIRKFEQIPYINHPNRVAESLLQHTQNENIIIAAILHDVVEDSHYTIKHIDDLFGDDVAKLVRELTSDPADLAKLGKTNYLIHKLNTISDDALLIKLADRRDNLRDFAVAPQKFIDKYKASTYEILNNINRPLNSAHQDIIKEIREILESY